METILSVKGLCKTYGKQAALDHVDIALPEGKIVGLLGPNGSGKTTLLKLIAGLLTPDDGRILVCGQPVGLATKSLVSYLPDRLCFNRERRIREQLDYYQDFFSDFDRTRAEAMLADLKIDPNARIRTLSKGTQEKAQLVLAMSRRAKLYLLDEPMGGVDPAARDYILDTIVSNYDPRATIVISTHLIADVERLLDECIFLSQGRVLLQGNADTLREEKGKSLDELFREVFACSENL